MNHLKLNNSLKSYIKRHDLKHKPKSSNKLSVDNVIPGNFADGGNSVVTPANANGFSTITFADVGDTATLIFTGSKWNIVSSHSVTIA